MPGLILMDADMNVHRQAPKDLSLKYPPGLGYGSLPEASMSSPSLLPSQKNITRRRSGSFTFTSGSNFASGNIFHGGYNTLTRPHHEPSHTPRLGKRSAGLWSQRYGSDGPSDPISPPPRTPQGSSSSSSFFDFSATPSTKFDPFGSDFDEQPALPMASSTSYSHYWEYDPSTNGPKLRSTPPKKPLSLLSSPRPRTIELSPPTLRKSASTTSLPSSKPRSSPPTSPTYKSPSKLAPLSVPDRNARSKLLAGILLNRVHAVGKPMRRRLLESDYLNRQYVKSGLSTVISLDY